MRTAIDDGLPRLIVIMSHSNWSMSFAASTRQNWGKPHGSEITGELQISWNGSAKLLLLFFPFPHFRSASQLIIGSDHSKAWKRLQEQSFQFGGCGARGHESKVHAHR